MLKVRRMFISFLILVVTYESSLWRGNVVSRRKSLKSVIKNSNTKKLILLSRSCGFDFSYLPLTDEAFENSLSGVLFGWW